MNEDDVLYVPDAVITYLEKTYPNKIPKDELSQFEYGKLAGIQTIIQKLKTVKQWREEDVQD